jgi:hypothetical protein
MKQQTGKSEAYLLALSAFLFALCDLDDVRKLLLHSAEVVETAGEDYDDHHN